MDKIGQSKIDEDDDECEWEDDDDDEDEKEEDEKENEDMVDDLAIEESKLKKNADSLVVTGPSPSVSKKSALRKSKGAEISEKLAEKKRQIKVRFASKTSKDSDEVASGRRGAAAASTSSSSAATVKVGTSDRANESMKKQFKKMKKDRKRNEKVASGLADGMDKAFSSLGGIGDDDYDFGVL